MNTITISDLMHLSVAERLQLVEDLWDSIAVEAVVRPTGSRSPKLSARRSCVAPRHTG
jgi:putative addiction module component (TIGR02574 family)